MSEFKMKKSCFMQVDTEVDKIIDFIDMAKREGFDAVEPISLKDTWADDIAVDNAKRIKNKLDEVGMKCSCYSMAVNMLTDNNPKKLLKKVVDLAEIMGSPYVHHTMQLHYKHKGLPIYQDVEQIFVDVSRETAEYAGERGITCIYEDQGYLINTPERLSILLNKINMPNTGVCLDVGNSLFFDIPAEDYAGVFGNVIKNVHIKDYLRKFTFPGFARGWARSISGNYLFDCPVGHGVVDFERIITILLENGYDGYFSLEGYGNYMDRATGVPISMQNLQYYYDRAAEKLNIK